MFVKNSQLKQNQNKTIKKEALLKLQQPQISGLWQ